MPTLFSGIWCCLLHERWNDCDGGGVSERERHWNGIRKVSKTIHRFVIVWLKMSEIESMRFTNEQHNAIYERNKYKITSFLSRRR